MSYLQIVLNLEPHEATRNLHGIKPTCSVNTKALHSQLRYIPIRDFFTYYISILLSVLTSSTIIHLLLYSKVSQWDAEPQKCNFHQNSLSMDNTHTAWQQLAHERLCFLVNPLHVAMLYYVRINLRELIIDFGNPHVHTETIPKHRLFCSAFLIPFRIQSHTTHTHHADRCDPRGIVSTQAPWTIYVL